MRSFSSKVSRARRTRDPLPVLFLYRLPYLQKTQDDNGQFSLSLSHPHTTFFSPDSRPTFLLLLKPAGDLSFILHSLSSYLPPLVRRQQQYIYIYINNHHHPPFTQQSSLTNLFLHIHSLVEELRACTTVALYIPTAKRSFSLHYPR